MKIFVFTFRILFKMFFLISLVLVNESLFAERIQIKENQSSVSLMEGVQHHVSEKWVDVRGYNDILVFPFKKNEGKTFSIGYSPKTVITYIPLEFNLNQPEKYFFILDFPSIDVAEFIVFDPSTKEEIYRKKTGDTFGFKERGIISEVFVFPIDVNKKKLVLDVILITKTSGSHKLPIRLESPDEFQRKATEQYFIWGIFIGLLFTFSLINIILLFIIKDTIFFYYFLYTASLVFLFFSGFGLGYRFLYPENPFLQDFMFVIASSLGPCFKITFYNKYLETGTYFRKFTFFLISIIIVFLVCLFGYIITKNQVYYSIILFFGIVTIFSLGLLSYLSMNHNKTAVYFLLAEFIVSIGVVVSYLSMNGIIPHNFFSYQVFYISVSFELVILSTAIGKNLYSIKLKQKALESASNAKGLFLSTMSHEIRTPLNGIIGFLDLLDSTELTQVQREYLGNSIHAGKALMNLLNDILDFSKIEAGKLNISKEKVNIIEIIEECISTMKPQADKKDIHLNFTYEPNLPPIIESDYMRIKQVILNLLSNAVKFTDQGSVIVKLNFEKISDIKGLYKFEVIDTGIGIKSEDLGKLFQSFTQADNSISRRFGGTGLGLAISNSIIKGMGSSIEVESIFGSGSKFSFTLESHFWNSVDLPETGPKIHAIEDDSGLLLGNLSILITEDDKMNMFISKRLVEKLCPNAKIFEAKTGLEAIEICQKVKFDLIFMDIQMPLKDGIEATKDLRSSLKIKSPIIGLSANALKDEIQNAMAVGMDFYLTKPIIKEQLKSTMIQSLSKKR